MENEKPEINYVITKINFLKVKEEQLVFKPGGNQKLKLPELLKKSTAFV